MIDTNSMYGNVQEEQDSFVQLQKQLKQKVEGQKLTAEEIQLPDFPKEYNPETALQTMFNMQEALQNILAAKRGTLAPTNKEDNFKNAVRSGYFMMSTVTEIWEFFDQLKKDNYEITDLVKYEIIDAWHFVMNQLLYLKYKPTFTLPQLYDFAVADLKTGTIGTSDLHYLVGEFIEADRKSVV